jgi:thiamine transport system ATP-binding protein
MSTGLAVRNVTVRYGSRKAANRLPPAISDITFDVARGEVVALTGPSGCGKSTLLRAIAGLQPLDAGSVAWAGEDLVSVPAHNRGFGFMFQDGQLFAHLSVAKNVGYGLAPRRVSKVARDARVDELLELVGLPGYGNRAVTELSGGERQRIALARSLAPSPRLLMLDEPLSALDRALRDRLADDLAQLLRATDTTAILVTHDVHEAETVSDRVLRMQAGQLIG